MLPEVVQFFVILQVWKLLEQPSGADSLQKVHGSCQFFPISGIHQQVNVVDNGTDCQQLIPFSSAINRIISSQASRTLSRSSHLRPFVANQT